MKTLAILLVAILANLLLVFGVLVAINANNFNHLSQVNWLTFTPLAILYAIVVSILGWGMGSLVNGLLVYPKKRSRNLRMSALNTGLAFLALILYFAWATSSFTGVPPKGHVHQGWLHADLLVKDISERGFKAF